MKRKKNLLIVIDMQNDFCLPDGALYVPGAEDDIQRVKNFIDRNYRMIDHIVLTQDNHQVIDISHPNFWVDKNGSHPDPFTMIRPDDLKSEKWLPVSNTDEVTTYINKLNSKGEFTHTIWPEHCIMGSRGAAVTDAVMQAVTRWARMGNYFEVIVKGTHPLTEYFGALRANIPVPGAPETGLNEKLVATFREYDNIVIVGEAKSHCVANTIKQMLELDDLEEKIIILEDCMSNVTGFEHVADAIYNAAKNRGTTWSNSTELNLN